ncbi:DUF5678 domain-containing protein [Sulfurisphaera ohwakuensis]|uniref:DUF5678 domain-containing protein n=1 Tax=Sulfurisphaera ohwakuensis TaxID=69656 RepID=A0A650CHU7_SULOH|nr:DUF5678 domain-containing protein [Sulfurisphaera ohwakuensis]MBB5253547.1 hypothetical protein [Sulfurisphaera ohwakuensis]QGR17431.1 hypothetical protein D1869_09655 [Sulfurisphaera ohwakuensis]
MPESLVVRDPKYLGKFIAVDENFNIIGYADSREELEKELTRKGYSIADYDIIYVPKSFKKNTEGH